MSNRMLLGVIATVIILLGILIIFSRDKTEATEPSSNNTYGTSEKNVVLMEAYSLGCPACADAHPLVQEIREEYGDRVIVRVVHYPLVAKFQNALAGHRAVEAAAKQGKFWEMNDLLFENRSLWVFAETQNSNPTPQIEVFAEQLGLDIEQFKQDFGSVETNRIINGDIKYLEGLGVSETPTFFLNGQKMENWKAQLQSTGSGTYPTLDEALGITDEEEQTDESTEDEAQEDDEATENNSETTPLEDEAAKEEEEAVKEEEESNLTE